jgi:hypothetical protein
MKGKIRTSGKIKKITEVRLSIVAMKQRNGLRRSDDIILKTSLVVPCDTWPLTSPNLRKYNQGLASTDLPNMNRIWILTIIVRLWGDGVRAEGDP